MITVHHLNNSRSQRVLWLLEELGALYEVKRYQRDAKTMLAPRELKHVHPLGKSPVITDNGNTIAETGAIIEYMLETLWRWPPHPEGRHARAAALHLLAPLCRRLGDDAAASQAGVHAHRRGRARPDARPRQASDEDGAAARLRSAACTAHELLGRGALQIPMVRRQRVHRRRHHDELPARSRSARAPAAARAR